VAQPKQEERKVVSDCGTCEQKLNKNTITNEENTIKSTGNLSATKSVDKIALKKQHHERKKTKKTEGRKNKRREEGERKGEERTVRIKESKDYLQIPCFVFFFLLKFNQ